MLTAVLQRPTLVLNRIWQPVGVATVSRSLVLLWNDNARVVTAMRDGAAIYRVVLGPYATKEEAERVGRESKQSFWVYEGGP